MGGVLLTFQLVCSVLLSTVLSDSINADYQKWITYICPLYRLIDFSYGMLLGKIFYGWETIQIFKKNNKAVLNVLEIMLVVVWAVQILLYRKSGLIAEGFRYSLFWLITSVAAVVLFTWASGVITKALNNKVLVFIGNISGIAFLLHQIIIGFSEIVIHNRYAVAIVAFAVTIIASIVYQRIEYAVRCKLKMV